MGGGVGQSQPRETWKHVRLVPCCKQGLISALCCAAMCVLSKVFSGLFKSHCAKLRNISMIGKVNFYEVYSNSPLWILKKPLCSKWLIHRHKVLFFRQQMSSFTDVGGRGGPKMVTMSHLFNVFSRGATPKYETKHFQNRLIMFGRRRLISPCLLLLWLAGGEQHKV